MTSAVAPSAHSAALACIAVPVCCQTATRRKTRQTAIAKTTMARTNPTISTINAVCCCTKNPDAATNWRASAVRPRTMATTLARSPNGINPIRAPCIALPVTSEDGSRAGTVDSSIECVDIASFLLHHYLMIRWYPDQALPCRMQQGDLRRLSPPHGRPGHVLPLEPTRFGHGHQAH